jgi:two-component system, sensor histidine kinase
MSSRNASLEIPEFWEGEEINWIDSSSQPWVVVEAGNLQILHGNLAAQSILQYTLSELRYRKLTDLEVQTDATAALAGQTLLEANNTRTYRVKSGDLLLFEFIVIPLPSADPKLLIGIYDVTERERLRSERDQMLAHYEKIADDSQKHFWSWDLVEGTIHRSSGLLASLGFEEPEMVQSVDWWQARIHPADRENVTESINSAIRERRLEWSSEYRFLKASGQYAHIYDQGMLTLDSFGVPTRIIGSMFDVTQRRSAEIERDRFIELSPEPKVVLDTDGKVQRANQAFCALMARGLDAVERQEFLTWVHPAEHGEFASLCRQIRIDEVRQTATVRMDNEREIYWNVSAYLPTGQIFLTGRDVTVERIERRRSRLIDTAIQNSHDLTIIVERVDDPQGNVITYANPAILEVLGYEPSDVIGERLGRFMPLPIDSEDGCGIASSLEGGEPTSEEFQVRHRDGHLVWIELNVQPIRDEGGTITHSVLAGRNVTQRKLDQATIEATNRELYSMLERIDDGFCALDRDFVVTYMNSRAESILRVRRVDVHNRRLWDVIPTLTTSEFYRPLQEAFHLQKPTFVTGFSRRFQRYYDLRVYPSGDGLSLFMSDVHDQVTAQQDLERTRDILQDILDRSLDVIVTTDQEGTFHTVSNASAQLWGYEPAELVGRSMQLLVHQEPPEDILSLKTAPSYHIRSYENQYRHKDGRIVDMMWSASRSAENGLTVAIGRDITEANIIKRGLQKALEDADRLAVEAQAASKAKTEFLRTISHELRTPMNGVLGMAQLLRGTSLDPRQAEYARILTESGTLLLGILNDILDLTQIEAGNITVTLQPMAIRSTVQAAVDTFRESARQKGLTLEFETNIPEDARFMGDSLRIRQVIGNLVSNAIKFTSQGGVRVRLEIRPLDKDICDVCIKVLDTGIGIAPIHHEKIFDRFYQVDMSATRIYGGSGLGLAICRRLTELMIGTLTVDSGLGSGSAFTLTIPLRRATDQDSSIAQRVPKQSEWGNRPPVLIVEDKLINVQVLGEWLDRFGIPYEVVENGIDALDQIESKTYSAVLLDIQLPGIDGYEVARRVRLAERGQSKHLTIVAVTALARLEDRQRCFEAGVDEYIAKPIMADEIKRVVAMIKRRA